MMRSEVLISNDVKATIAEIEALGGAVTQTLSDRVVVARLPPSLDPTALHSAQLWDASGQYQGDQVFREAVQLFRDRLANKPQDDDKDGFELDTPCCDCSAHEKPSSQALPVEGLKNPDNSQMTGDIAVAIVFVSSSTDSALAFSDDERAKLKSDVYYAFNFLTNAQPAAKIKFESYEYQADVPGDTQVANVRMSSSPSAVAFNGKLYCFYQGYGNDGTLWYSVYDGTSWAAAIQVSNVGISSSPSAVVFNGKLYCFYQGYGNDGTLWYSVFDGTNWAAAIQVNNVGMSYSPSAVVFWDKLYCFHQGKGNDGVLWYSVFDGENWSTDTRVGPAGMAGMVGISYSPSAVVFYDMYLLCFHQGYGDNGELWCSQFNGSYWSVDFKLEGVVISNSPSAVSIGGNLYCFHQGGGNNGELWFKMVQLGQWDGADTLVADVGITESPSCVYYKGMTYCLHQGGGSNNGQLFVRSFNWIDFGVYDTPESIWRNPALLSLGYEEGRTGTQKFAADLCDKYKVDRAFVAYLIKFPIPSPTVAYADTFGIRLCVQCSNIPKRIDRPVAHEICHIFGAGDEYGDCKCNLYGHYLVTNGNCINCTDYQVPCLMTYPAKWAICSYTQGQLGWRPQSGLFVFHQGSGNSGEMRYSALNETGWWADSQVMKCGMSSSPSAEMFDHKLYFFHQGGQNDGVLWYSVFDGKNWSTDTRAGPAGGMVGITDSPSAVVFNDKLYCLHHGYGDNGELWCSVFDGTNWAADYQLFNVGISNSPSAAVFNGKLYCFHQGYGENRQLWYSVFDGANWNTDTQVVWARISNSPSAVVFNGRLYCFHHGGDNNGTLWYSFFDGASWSSDVLVSNVRISSSPSMVVSNNKLYCFHQSEQNDGTLWYSVFDGENWGTDTQVLNVGISSSPSAVVCDFT